MALIIMLALLLVMIGVWVWFGIFLHHGMRGSETLCRWYRQSDTFTPGKERDDEFSARIKKIVCSKVDHPVTGIVWSVIMLLLLLALPILLIQFV